MALMAKGIVGGEMAWPLVIMGGFFSLVLILLGGGSPMLVAVGMYLPLYSTFAMFVGGLIKTALDFRVRKKEEAAKQAADRTGLLLASGFVAGESLTAVILAFLISFHLKFTTSPMFDLATDVFDRPVADWYKSYVANAGWLMPWLARVEGRRGPIGRRG